MYLKLNIDIYGECIYTSYIPYIYIHTHGRDMGKKNRIFSLGTTESSGACVWSFHIFSILRGVRDTEEEGVLTVGLTHSCTKDPRMGKLISP